MSTSRENLEDFFARVRKIKEIEGGYALLIDGEWRSLAGPASEDVQPDKQKYTPTYDLLVLEPQAEPIYLVVKNNYSESGSSDRDAQKSYWYNEHTCPTNWIRDTVVITIGNSDDPHGLFSFVRSVPVSKNPLIGEGETEGFDAPKSALTIFEMFPEVKCK